MTTKSLDDDDEQERWGLPYLRLGYLGVRCPEVQHCRLFWRFQTGTLVKLNLCATLQTIVYDSKYCSRSDG